MHLTRTEFQILHLLMRNVGLVLERGVMYERIWGFDFEGSSRSLDVHVGYLRRKLEDGGHPRTIETVRGVGFVLRGADR
ncbi:MAG: winged helix-turn-helix domain-containing protein [Actinomycetota bacterium]